MIDRKTKAVLNYTGEVLSKDLPEFYGKVTFNYFNGVYVSSNVEQSIKPDNLKKEQKNEGTN